MLDAKQLTPLALEIDVSVLQLRKIQSRLGKPAEQQSDFEAAIELGHSINNQLTKMQLAILRLATRVKRPNQAERSSIEIFLQAGPSTDSPKQLSA